MGQVSVQVNGRSYQMACDDGQESHLIKLAGVVDEKVQLLTQSVGQIGDTRLLLMASIMVADEVDDLRNKLASASAKPATAPPSSGNAEDAKALTQTLQALENLSTRLSGLAESLEVA